MFNWIRFIIFFSGCFVIFQLVSVQHIMNAQLSLGRRASIEKRWWKKILGVVGRKCTIETKSEHVIVIMQLPASDGKIINTNREWKKSEKSSTRDRNKYVEKNCRATQTSFPLSEQLFKDSRVAHPECADWNCIKIGLSTSQTKTSAIHLDSYSSCICNYSLRPCVLVQLHPFYDRSVGVFSSKRRRSQSLEKFRGSLQCTCTFHPASSVIALITIPKQERLRLKNAKKMITRLSFHLCNT